MSVTDPASCTNCLRLQARVDVLEAELAALKQVVAQLQVQLASARKDSSTSSKPPSSDIVKPPKALSAQHTPRSRGAQPGHLRHERALFPTELVNDFFDHRPDPCCPDCGHEVRPTGFDPRVIQQVDIPEVPL